MAKIVFTLILPPPSKVWKKTRQVEKTFRDKTKYSRKMKHKEKGVSDNSGQRPSHRIFREI